MTTTTTSQAVTVDLDAENTIYQGCYWSVLLRVYNEDGTQMDLDGNDFRLVIRKSVRGAVQAEFVSSGLEHEFDAACQGSVELRGSTKDGDDDSILSELVITGVSEQTKLMKPGEYRHTLVLVSDGENMPFAQGKARVAETMILKD